MAAVPVVEASAAGSAEEVPAAAGALAAAPAAAALADGDNAQKRVLKFYQIADCKNYRSVVR